MKTLLKDSTLDPKILVTAAYAHDWGYIDLFQENCDYDIIQDRKILHMELGAKRIVELLRSKCRSGYTDNQIERIRHLVYVHDRLQQLKDDDELMLMEADTMGALDSDLVKPTYDKADHEKYIVEVEGKRRPLFIHPTAISNYPILLQKNNDFYENQYKN